MDLIVGQTGFFSLGEEKENSEFKPVKLRLKVDLVSYPARAEGLVNRIQFSQKIHFSISMPLVLFNL